MTNTFCKNHFGYWSLAKMRGKCVWISYFFLSKSITVTTEMEHSWKNLIYIKISVILNILQITS